MDVKRTNRRIGGGMKKIWKKEFSDTLWFMSACFVLGMAAGIILANLAYPYHTSDTEAMTIYVIQQVKSAELSYDNYFWHLLYFRGKRILLVILGGMTAMAAYFATVLMVFLGILFGAMSSLMILQFGLKGFLLLIIGLLPQILLYIPMTWMMLGVIYHMKGKILKKSKDTRQEYFVWMGICGAGYLLGIVLESYVNLPLLRLFVGTFAF